MLSSRLKILFLFMAVFTACGPQVHCQLSESNLTRDLFSDGYYLEDWFPAKDNIGLLLFNHRTENVTGYYAYALVDSRGELLNGPDSVCSTMQNFIPGTSTFDEDGTLFIYSNSGHDFLGPMYRITYDPVKKESITKSYPNIDIGTVMYAKNLPGLGNILWLLGGIRQPFHSMIIDKYDGNEPEIMSFDRSQKEHGRTRIKLAIEKISENRIMAIGMSPWGPGTDSTYYYRLNKYIIALRDKSIISYESITEREIADSQYSRFILPYDNLGRIAKVRDRYYYLMPIELRDKGKSELLNTAFVEIDSTGDFVGDSKAVRLSFEESSLTEPPANFLLQHWQKKNRHRIHLWTISFDQFPNIIIDKGE